MTSDTVIVTWRIEHACRLLRRLIMKNPVVPDAIPDAEAVQAWALVTPLYDGIEQALKHLLLISDVGLTREHLKRAPYRHNLESLFSALSDADKDHIFVHFREHRSLHNYDTQGSFTEQVDEFVSHINRSVGEDGVGLVKWRYVLLDGIGAIPQTHLWSMWEVWDGICCRIRHREYNKEDDCFRLSRRLFSMFESPLAGVSVPYPEYVDNLNEWHSRTCDERLAEWIDLLVTLDKCTAPALTGANRFCSVLHKMAVKALRRLDAEREDPDKMQLVRRIREAEYRLSWDRKGREFRSDAREGERQDQHGAAIRP